MNYKTLICGTLDKIKCKNQKGILWCIPIYNGGNLYGYLRPITIDFRDDIPECAAMLSDWRNENPSMSAHPFVSTPKSTEQWLIDSILNREDRALWLIIGEDSVPIGHIGFSNFDYRKRSCELDAVLRGKKDMHPGMMHYAMDSLLGFGIADLKLAEIRLRVLPDNGHAIRFYKKNGFYILKNLEPTDAAEEPFVTMKLDMDLWLVNHTDPERRKDVGSGT